MPPDFPEGWRGLNGSDRALMISARIAHRAPVPHVARFLPAAFGMGFSVLFTAVTGGVAFPPLLPRCVSPPLAAGKQGERQDPHHTRREDLTGQSRRLDLQSVSPFPENSIAVVYQNSTHVKLGSEPRLNWAPCHHVRSR